MKYILLSCTAALLVLSIYLGLSHVLNKPANKGNVENDEVTIEFVDLDFENPQCQPITNQIKNLIKAPQTCKTAADCSIAHFGCPFGCNSYVNLSYEITINSLVTEREQLCNSKCRYRCLSDGVKRIPACINNRCDAVESIDGTTQIREFIEKNSPLKKQSQ